MKVKKISYEIDYRDEEKKIKTAKVSFREVNNGRKFAIEIETENKTFHFSTNLKINKTNAFHLLKCCIYAS